MDYPRIFWRFLDRSLWFQQRVRKFTNRRKDELFLNMKVDFIICGVQKGGTSALVAYLREHPEICMAKRKEVHFFDTESNFTGNRPDYSAYHAAFNPDLSHKLIGEATPSYMYWQNAPKRIREYNPAMKLIVVLRNPIERAYSHWNMAKAKKFESLSFWDAIQNERERCRTVLPYQHKMYSYVDRGFYLEQLQRLWAYFPKEQVLVLRNECLRDDPTETLQTVCSFLGISPFQRVEDKDIHSRPYDSRITDQEKEYLQSVYEHEIHQIEQTLNWDCSSWLS